MCLQPVVILNLVSHSEDCWFNSCNCVTPIELFFLIKTMAEIRELLCEPEISHSCSQNCWDVFVSSPPLNVGVHDLPTESQ